MNPLLTDTQHTRKRSFRQALNARPGRWLEILRWSLTNPGFLFAVLGLLVGASLLASLHTGAWHWFQRSGALAVAVGAVLSTQRALIAMLDGSIAYPRRSKAASRDPSRQGESAELRSCVCGFLLVAMGTLIWAYGDLLGCLLNWNASCLG